MRAALRGTYVEFVLYMGITEKYPLWFEEEIYRNIYMDESRYTFWIPQEERRMDYYEKTLIEDYSVFLKKPNGEIHVTDYDVFQELYVAFQYDAFTNSGIAAFEDDCIDYVECQPGVLTAEYPLWFYEFFTEAVHLYQEDTTILFYENGEVTVNNHCVFLKNRYGEIKGMLYDEFLKYYDDNPVIGGLGNVF
jgi:hypothetical protein